MPPTPTLEASLETRFADGVKRAGGILWKLVPIEAGIPDRLVIGPRDGKIFLVELKTDVGDRSPIQRHTHARLASRGVTVHTVFGKAGIDDWLARHLS